MDLKEFLISRSLNLTAYKNCNPKNEVEAVPIEQLGLFFWERRGNQFAQMVLEHEKTTKGKMNDLSFVISEAEFYASGDYEEDTGNSINSKVVLNARDFLDCLDCLGEEKVKELIGGLRK